MSGNTSRRRGRARELDYVDHLKSEGWVAFRTDGSGDIVAGKNGVTLLIQVKSTIGPWTHFGPSDRARLSADADQAGWYAALLHCPRGVPAAKGQLYMQNQWPGGTEQDVYVLEDWLPKMAA